MSYYVLYCTKTDNLRLGANKFDIVSFLSSLREFKNFLIVCNVFV